MAVLSLMLAGNAQARSIPALAPVVERSNAWTQGKKFLVVPYHMIGADSMESAILGQYAEHVLKLHPGAPVPGFYLAEGLFRDAVRLLEQMGDGAFFGKLNDLGEPSCTLTVGRKFNVAMNRVAAIDPAIQLCQRLFNLSG